MFGECSVFRHISKLAILPQTSNTDSKIVIQLEDAKSIVHDCRQQLKAEIDRLGVTEEAMGESDEIEAATMIRTGPHRQRLRAGMYLLPRFL